MAIDAMTPTTLYAGTLSGGVFKSTDGAAHWSPASINLPSGAVYALAIDPWTPNTLYAGTNGNGVFRSINGGETWSVFNTGLTKLVVRALAIDPQTPTTLYAGTDGGGVFAYQAGGPTKTFTVPPCRVLDTRLASPLGPIPANGTRGILVAGDLTDGGIVDQGGATTCGVPDAATAVFANVVAVNADGPGHLTVYPFDSSLPLASTLNFTTGQTIANGVLVPVCPPTACTSDLNITMGPAGAHLVIDVTGYLAPLH